MASTFISLPVTSSGSISGPIDVQISASNDSIKISDGTDTLAINADGSINANIGGSASITGNVDAVLTGLNEFQYNEVLAVAAGATTAVVTKFFPVEYKLRRINATGSNVSTWTVILDATDIDKIRSNHTDLNVVFDYETGITIPAGSTVVVEVTNAGASAGDFSARLLFSAK